MNTWLSWSSGKDSARCLYQLLQHKHPVSGLFTSINQKRDRVAMHGTRVSLLEWQAQRLNISLHMIPLPEPCDNDTYQNIMRQFIKKAQLAKVTHMAFGDLYLQDVRDYREKQLADTSIKPLFPLWQQDTKTLANDLINSGFKAILTCVDTKQIPESFVGREYNQELLADLPPTADPCGENGEFHTFIYDAPIFSAPIAVKTGEIHQSGQFSFIDIKTSRL